MKEFHEIAQKHLQGKALLYDIDVHTNIDTLEGLRGAQKLLFDIIDTPDIIHEAMNQIRKLYTKKIYTNCLTMYALSMIEKALILLKP